MAVTPTAKRLAWLAVIAINAFFVYFSILRGSTRSTSWQIHYLWACCCQLLVEILIYETVECVWIHFTIPSLVREEVATAVETVKHATNLAFQKEEKISMLLDSPKHFFVSRQLAEEFPNLFESAIVMAFQSYFPPSDLDTISTLQAKENDENSRGLMNNEVRVRQKKKNNVLMSFLQRYNLSVVLVALLQHLGTVSIRIQQVIIHTLQPILFACIVIFSLYLFKYPMMALVPLSLLLYEAISYAHRSKYESHKPIPAIIDSTKYRRSLAPSVTNTNDERAGRQTRSIRLVTDNANNAENVISEEEAGSGSREGRVVGSAPQSPGSLHEEARPHVLRAAEDKDLNAPVCVEGGVSAKEGIGNGNGKGDGNGNGNGNGNGCIASVGKKHVGLREGPRRQMSRLIISREEEEEEEGDEDGDRESKSDNDSDDALRVASALAEETVLKYEEDQHDNLQENNDDRSSSSSDCSAEPIADLMTRFATRTLTRYESACDGVDDDSSSSSSSDDSVVSFEEPREDEVDVDVNVTDKAHYVLQKNLSQADYAVKHFSTSALLSYYKEAHTQNKNDHSPEITQQNHRNHTSTQKEQRKARKEKTDSDKNDDII